MRIDGGNDVLPGHGFLVEFSVLVGSLHLVAGVSQVDVITLLAAKVFLPCRLQARLAYIVPALVYFRLLLNLPVVHLRNIAEQVPSGIEGIFPHGAHLPAESGKIIGALCELHVFLDADLLCELQGLPADARTVFPVVCHLLPHPESVQVEGLRKRQGVESRHFARSDQDVVADTVAHQHLSVAVVNYSARRIDGMVDHGIVVGVPLVGIVHYLDCEQTHQEDEDYCPEADQEPVAAS